MLCPCQKREPIFLPLRVLNKILFLLWEHSNGLMACSSTCDHPIPSHHVRQANGEGLEPQSECHTPTPRWIASYSCKHIVWHYLEQWRDFPSPRGCGQLESSRKKWRKSWRRSLFGMSLTNKPLFPEQTESGILSPKARVLGVLRRLGPKEIRELPAWGGSVWFILKEIAWQAFAFLHTYSVRPLWRCGHIRSLSPALSISFSGYGAALQGRKAIWCQGFLWALGIRPQNPGIGAQLLLENTLWMFYSVMHI